MYKESQCILIIHKQQHSVLCFTAGVSQIWANTATIVILFTTNQTSKADAIVTPNANAAWLQAAFALRK